MAKTILPSREEILNKIFSSRTEFNKEKYIKRDYYERAYQKALRSPKCIIVKGFSGSGKTWLTHNILIENKKECEWINLSRIGSLNNGFNDFFKSQLKKYKAEISEDKKAGASVGFASGGLTTSNTYKLEHDYFYEYLKNNQHKYIIFDNLETIINNQPVIEALGAIITLIDDPLVLEMDVRFIIIGTNSDIMSVFGKLPNIDTIRSRTQDISEIKGFNLTECSKYIMENFKKIRIELENPIEFINFVYKCTNGIPQNVNDLCAEICDECINREKYCIDDIPTNTNIILKEAQLNWIRSTFSSDYTKIFKLYTANKAIKATYNNYILFMLSELEEYGKSKTSFDVDYFKTRVSEYFIDNDKIETSITKKRIKMYLNELSDTKNNNNILEKIAEDNYTIRDIKAVLCIRNILYLDDSNNVSIQDISEC